MYNGEYTLVKPPAEYPGMRYQGRYALEHRVVWWENTGEMPADDEHVHHKNGDKLDNRFENLEKVTHTEHRARHNKGPAMVTLVCPTCDTMFDRERRQTHLSKPGQKATYCSRSCGVRAQAA